MGRYLETAPTVAEAAHTLGILVMSAPPPADATLDTPEDLLRVAQRMLGGSDRFRTVESRLLPDSAIGADCITFHFEADAHVSRTLHAIREDGCLAGIALNPGTPAISVSELTAAADVVLCMSVNPGWGGQPFIASSPDKVSRLSALAPSQRIEVDGGIDPDTVGSVAEAGATLFVAGSAVFGDPEPGEAYQRIAAAARAD